MNERSAAVATAMDDIRSIEAEVGITREGVDAILARLLKLAAQRELFPLEDFPAPDADSPSGSSLYRLAQDADDRFALYAQSTRDGTKTPAHNHTTWAVIAGFDGQELNRFYDRNGDDGVTETHQHMVEVGTGVAMLPDDLHSIHIEGGALNFHCYGLALERLDKREYWSESDNSWKYFTNVSNIVEARTGLTTC